MIWVFKATLRALTLGKQNSANLALRDSLSDILGDEHDFVLVGALVDRVFFIHRASAKRNQVSGEALIGTDPDVDAGVGGDGGMVEPPSR